MKHVLKAIRAPQWLKNVLVFVPLLTSHRIFFRDSVGAATLAFIAFCCAASAGYIANDLADRENDRVHPTKRHRPFASGALGLNAGIAIIVVLVAVAVLLALLLPRDFRIVLATYAALTAAYSFRLKRMLLIDVVALAALYTLRIIAGTTAINVVLSPWLLAFSMFVFFSLALIKRASELDALGISAPEAVRGRAYELRDSAALGALGAASACTAVLVLTLYVNSPEVRVLYTRPFYLWGLAPLFLYFLGRLWIVARRGYVEGDPLLYAARDRGSYGVIIGALVLVWLAL